MKVYFSRRHEFSASHRLFRPDISDAENSALFGKCANPHGHGHNYQLQVTVAGEIDQVTGIVCDLVRLDKTLAEHILAEYDHTNLNVHDDFTNQIPTTENLCIALYRRLEVALGDALAEVRVEETSNNAFVYAGGQASVEAQHLDRCRDRVAAQLRNAGQEMHA